MNPSRHRIAGSWVSQALVRARPGGEVLREAGFVDIRFERVGPVPAFVKSMIAVARRSST
jgi:hypothetical protein